VHSHYRRITDGTIARYVILVDTGQYIQSQSSGSDIKHHARTMQQRYPYSSETYFKYSSPNINIANYILVNVYVKLQYLLKFLCLFCGYI